MVMDFVNFMTSKEIQTFIRDFKVDVYGESLFFPNSSNNVRQGKTDEMSPVLLNCLSW